MVDLVGTCPQYFWQHWIEEGDAAGEPETGQEWSWYTKSCLTRRIAAGDRFYVVAHGCLRGYALVTRVEFGVDRHQIVRRGGAVAVTIPLAIPGFQGLRPRWWKRDLETPFQGWRDPRDFLRWRNKDGSPRCLIAPRSNAPSSVPCEPVGASSALED